jgi:hypothetical protein
MKLSTMMFIASILMLTLSNLILFGVSPEQEFWKEAVFMSAFNSVFCIVFCCAADANGH